MEPYGLLSYEQALDVFGEQAQALVDGGADLLWVETMSDLNEAKAAVEAARQVTDRPVFCSLSFGASGRTMMGVSPAQAVETLVAFGFDGHWGELRRGRRGDRACFAPDAAPHCKSWRGRAVIP